jgi:hypothetical protein
MGERAARLMEPALRNLLTNAHFRIDVYPDASILRVTRTGVTFASKAEVDTSCRAVESALNRHGRATSCVIVDSRDAPGRNDPQFEAWFSPYRKGMIQGFRRAAILVRMAVGKLQVDRLLKNDGSSANEYARTFVDEQQALAWLRAALEWSEPADLDDRPSRS